jgi:Xaa-Pro dipeptidase
MFFNKDRATEYMRQCDVQALIATSPANITYFSGWSLWLDPIIKGYMLQPGASSGLALPGFAVAPLEGEPALVVLPLFAVNAADLWVRDIRVFGLSGLEENLTSDQVPENYRRLHELLLSPNNDSSSLEALTSVIEEKGLGAARIGLEMEGMASETLNALKDKLPKSTLLDCSNLLRLVRMVKSDYEIKILTRSAEINEQAGMETLAEAKPGTRLKDMTRSYRIRAAEQDAELDHFAIGPRGLGMTTQADYELAEGDVMFVDFGCIYQSCFSDTGLTLALGELPEPVMDRFETLHTSVIAGMEAVRPGAKGSSAREAMWEVVSEKGYSALNPHGHGVGLDVRDYPTIVADNGLRISDDCIDVPSDLPFEENMVFNLESPMFCPGVASLQVERSFVVTAKGCRPLIPQDRSQPYFPLMT